MPVNDLLDTRKQNGKRLGITDVLYLLPFLLTLLATSFSVTRQAADLASSAASEGGTYRLIVFGVIYLLTVVLLLFRIQSIFSVLRSNWIYLLFLTYVITSSLWSLFPEKVFISWGHFVGNFLACVAAVLVLRGNEKAFWRLMLLFSLLVAVSTIATVALVPSRGLMEFSGRYRWVGLAPNANTLGMALMLAVWSAINFYLAESAFLAKGIAFVVLLMTIVCLYGSNSMTSIIVSMFMVMAYCLLRALRGQAAAVRIVSVIVFLSLILASVVGVYLVAPHVFTAEEFFGFFGRSPTLTGRTGLWKTALEAIREKPLFGWSFDGLKTFRETYWLPLRASHFHNGYLDLLVRGGITGIVFVFVVIGQALYNLCLVGRKSIMVARSFTVLISAILIHNLTEISLGSSPHSLWLMLTFTMVYLNDVAVKTRAFAAPANDNILPESDPSPCRPLS